MAKEPSETLITEAPLTTDAREALLREQFSADFPHDGKLLVPDDTFYTIANPIKQAKNMQQQLCDWLGIEPKRIGLVFEGQRLDPNDSSHYRIFVEKEAMHNEFVLGASLAHALVRYLIEDRKQIRLAARDQQDALIATASILFGLGLVISNGLLPRYPWLEAVGIHKRVGHQLLGHVQPGQFHQQLRAYLKRYRITEVHYAGCCTPWTAQRIGIRLPEKQSHAVHVAKHNVHITRLKLFGTAWLMVMIAGLTSVVIFHRAMPVDRRVQAAQDRANFLKQLAQTCHDKVSYNKQYTDTSDVMGQQSLDAQLARCTSLDNEYRSAQADYDSLLTN